MSAPTASAAPRAARMLYALNVPGMGAVIFSSSPKALHLKLMPVVFLVLIDSTSKAEIS